MAREQASALETYRSSWGGTAGRALDLPLRGRMEDAAAVGAVQAEPGPQGSWGRGRGGAFRSLSN